MLRVATEAVSTITAVTINMKGGKLDYQQNSEAGLHVIAIGGLALSRGLTLEGLVVSYILRNTAASDTLMQMARWFGYRPDYEDLCRVYLPAEFTRSLRLHSRGHRGAACRGAADAAHWTYAGGFRTPCSQSPTAIRITAANKMRTATRADIGAGLFMQSY